MLRFCCRRYFRLRGHLTWLNDNRINELAPGAILRSQSSSITLQEVYMKKVLIAIALSALPAVAFADNVGNCGWGSKVFDGQKVVAAQVFAVTTNGTFGNQTFGISSGTSGCTQDGMVTSTWKTSMFIDGNKERLARDMAIGGGETLDSLAHLMGIRDEHRAQFNRAAQRNLTKIFPSEHVATEQIVVALKDVLSSDRILARYAASI